MNPDEMRALVAESVPPLDEIGTQLPTQKGMAPLTKPPSMRPPSGGDVVELAREDRKTQKARARELQEARDRAEAAARERDFATGSIPRARKSGMTLTWLVIAALIIVATVAVISRLR